MTCLAALLFAASATPTLNAFTYTNENAELLLVFRKAGLNDVLFNLGTVSNLLSKPDASVTPVTNFRLGALTATYGANLNGVSFSLLAVTTATDPLRRAWVTDVETDPLVDRFQVSGSRHGQIRSKIDAIGQFPEDATTGSQTNEYIIAPSEGSSPTYVMSSAGAQDPSTLSGSVLFSVEGVAPATVRFWQLNVGTVTTPAIQVGSFALTSGGALTFTKGTGGGGCTAPTINTQPANATIFAGGTTNFFVGASGATSYQWQFNSVNIPGATSASYSLTAHTSNAGPYRVIATATGGCSSTSSVATLTVNLPGAAGLRQLSKTNGTFFLTLTGAVAAYYEVQANTNLANTNGWATIRLLTNSGGSTVFSDPATNAPQKFYRAIAR